MPGDSRPAPLPHFRPWAKTTRGGDEGFDFGEFGYIGDMPVGGAAERLDFFDCLEMNGC